MLIYETNDLLLTATRTYQTFSGEGWGLTYDGFHLVASDGSSHLSYFKLPDLSEKTSSRLELVKDVVVKDHKGIEIHKINELEYVKGIIYGNIWYQDNIVKIDGVSGLVVEVIELSKLYPQHRRPRKADCMNGIAYDKTDGTGFFYLTGKLWPKQFIVQL